MGSATCKSKGDILGSSGSSLSILQFALGLKLLGLLDLDMLAVVFKCLPFVNYFLVNRIADL